MSGRKSSLRLIFPSLIGFFDANGRAYGAFLALEVNVDILWMRWVRGESQNRGIAKSRNRWIVRG